MKTFSLLFVLSLFLCSSCGGEKDVQSKPLSVKGEKVYAMRGKITARDKAMNALTIDHEAIPGFMDAMTMDYTVRGADVEQLPADGVKISARLHVTEEGYWVTEVTKVP